MKKPIKRMRPNSEALIYSSKLEVSPHIISFHAQYTKEIKISSIFLILVFYIY